MRGVILRSFACLLLVLGTQASVMSPLETRRMIEKAFADAKVLRETEDVRNINENEKKNTELPTTAPPTYHTVDVGDKGTARGTILKSFQGNDFYAFMSLPYAKPPVDELRFKYPEAWEGPWPQETEENHYDATWLRARCPQASLAITGVIAGREDCLKVSVYTPQAPETIAKPGLPVMVFVHGGAYMSGDAFLYVPTKLMDRDVVVVVVQYRLALLGFLAAGIPEAPGNMGLMDQIAALRWVQDHISYFGGNPDQVTVFGQSAGGASASWMYITPLTNETYNSGKQLIHGTIPMSGSAFEEWTIDSDPVTSFKHTAEVIGCWGDEDTNEEMLACMRSKTFVEVIQAANKIYGGDRREGGLGFKGLCPVVQSDLAGTGLELVIPKDPREIVADGEFLRIPVMSGSVRDEGSLVLGLTYKDYMVTNNISINDREFLKYDAIPSMLTAFGLDDKTGSVSQAMIMAFLPTATMGDWETMEGGMVDMDGVMFLKSGLWELMTSAYLVDPQAPPMFFYSWEFESNDSLFDWIFMAVPDIPVVGGVSHADELIYLFHLPGDLDERERNTSDRMLTLWTNFAKYGNPTPEEAKDSWVDKTEQWQPFNTDDQSFMLIQDQFTMDQDFTTRWNYHSLQADNSTEVPPTVSPDLVPKSDYDQVSHERQQFQIATGVLGGITGCLVILSAVLVFKANKAHTTV